jgi:hypothetical protein
MLVFCCFSPAQACFMLFFVVSLMHKLVYVCNWVKQHRAFVNDIHIFLKQHPNKVFYVCFFLLWHPNKLFYPSFLLFDY